MNATPTKPTTVRAKFRGARYGGTRVVRDLGHYEVVLADGTIIEEFFGGYFTSRGERVLASVRRNHEGEWVGYDKANPSACRRKGGK